MDVTKAPTTIDLASPGVGTAASSASASPSSAAAGVSTASNASTAVTAAADRVDIQPLDVAAALQILIAEVRAELPLPGANTPAGMALGMELTDLAPRPNTPPALQTAELAAPGIVAADLEAQDIVAPDLVAQDLVAPGMPAAVQTPSAPVPAEPLPPTQPGGLALLESQAMPTEAPIQEPLPEAPDLAAILLGSAVPVGPETQGPGYLPEPADPSAGAGAAAVPVPPTLRPDGSAGWPQTSLVIRPGFDLGPLEPLFAPPGARLSSPAQASPVLMRLFLQAVPEQAGNPATWSAAVTQLEVTLQSALDRAVAAVEQWRNVPQVVVDAARETRSLVMSQLRDEPPGPLWLRPEWMWLSPRMERFRRRRRLARRGLTDPDLWSLREDDIRPEERERRHDEP